MKGLFLLTATLEMAIPLAVRVNAGETMQTEYRSQPPSEIFGTGFYSAIDIGANVYQDRGGDRVFTNEFGDTLAISPKNDVGFFGGIKVGYVFGTGVFRPTVEGDFFYNGFRGGADSTLTIDGAVVRNSTGTSFMPLSAMTTR